MNLTIRDAFAALSVDRCNNKVGSLIIQALQRQMHKDRVKKAKTNRRGHGA